MRIVPWHLGSWKLSRVPPKARAWEYWDFHQKKTLQSIKTPTELSQAEMVMHHSDLSICSTSPVALQTKKLGSCSVPVACVHTFAVFSRSTPQHCQLLCIQKTLRYLQARQCVTNHSLFGDLILLQTNLKSSIFVSGIAMIVVVGCQGQGQQMHREMFRQVVLLLDSLSLSDSHYWPPCQARASWLALAVQVFVEEVATVGPHVLHPQTLVGSLVKYNVASSSPTLQDSMPLPAIKT